MASEGHTPARRVSLRPRPLVLLVMALLATCTGFAYAGLRTADRHLAPEASPADRGAKGAAPPGARPGATVRAVGSIFLPPAAAGRDTGGPARSAETELPLGGVLAAARRDGGSPIAVVTEPTTLRAEPTGRARDRIETQTEFGSPRVLAVVDREGTWLEVMAAELPNGETGWVSARGVDVEGTDYALRASVGARILEVRRRGRLVRRIRVAVGGPDTPTPTGEFAVTDKMRMTENASAYGCCALALTGHQPHVPEGWSGGDRLAVHGTRDESTIGHAVSLGCLRAREADMRWLIARVPLGTPVEISP